MARYPDGFDVEGPVQPEVFVVWLAGDHLELTGPCGPAPWLLELGPADHPVEVVTRIVRDVIGEPLLVHSTSWRRDRDAVILSFVVAQHDPDPRRGAGDGGCATRAVRRSGRLRGTFVGTRGPSE